MMFDRAIAALCDPEFLSSLDDEDDLIAMPESPRPDPTTPSTASSGIRYVYWRPSVRLWQVKYRRTGPPRVHIHAYARTLTEALAILSERVGIDPVAARAQWTGVGRP